MNDFDSVHTRVLVVDPAHPDPDAIASAAQTIRSGRLVAFPTETVYGLGANALDAAAIGRIYAAKRRPANDPVIVHIHDAAQLETLAATVPDAAYTLANTFWPGPLTFVLRRGPDVPANIAAGRDTVAVRMPSHPVALALLKAADVPIAAPSANTFTRPSATTAAHVLQDLRGRVDVVVDAGPTPIGLESTVIDLTGESPVVLRPGGVVMDDLRRLLPDVTLSPRYVATDAAMGESAPGQMLKHYSPDAAVLLFSGPLDAVDAVLHRMHESAAARLDDGVRVGVLVADEDAAHFADLPGLIVRTLGPRGDFAAIGHELFAALRRLDEQGTAVILVRDFGREGLGAALWDRLLRAAEGRVITVT